MTFFVIPVIMECGNAAKDRPWLSLSCWKRQNGVERC